MVQLISSHTSLHAYGTRQLFRCAQVDAGNAQPLLQIAFWCIGEFGDLLVSSASDEEGGASVSESEVLELFERLLQSTAMSIQTREYALVAREFYNADFTWSKTLRSIFYWKLPSQIAKKSVFYCCCVSNQTSSTACNPGARQLLTLCGACIHNYSVDANFSTARKVSLRRNACQILPRPQLYS